MTTKTRIIRLETLAASKGDTDQPGIIQRFIRDLLKVYGDPESKPGTLTLENFSDQVKQVLARVFGGA